MQQTAKIRINKNINLIDLSIYLQEHNTLILSDFHIGYEEMLAGGGSLVPRFQLSDTLARLENIFNKINRPLKLIIINGDLKHEFGSILRTEWRNIIRLIDYLLLKAQKIIIIKGNHDTILEPIAGKRKIAIKKSHIIRSILITHGDSIDTNSKSRKIKTIIIGHEHPALGIRHQSRYERYKCFLVGKWKGKTLIVQPSFNLLTEGTDVLRESLLSPYLSAAEFSSKKGFSAFVVTPTAILKFNLNKMII